MPAELLETVRARADAPATPDAVRWLVDNAEAYDALLDAIGAAQRSVWMTQLAFDADCLSYSSDAQSDMQPGRPLIDAIVAASSERAVDVRILLNATLLLDTGTPLRAFLARRGAAQVQVRGIRDFPQLLHAKIVVIDGSEAFMIGSPFANGYWDDSSHQVKDARRPARELGGRPLHDLSCAITGAAVSAVESHFVTLWNDASTGPGDHHRLPATRADSARSGAIRIARTVPRRVLPGRRDGISEILTAIERGIASAESLIYLEHQYLSARPVIAALTAALERSPALEVIAVLNQNADVTAYRGWQNARLRESGLLDHPRVGLFALWSAERARTSEMDWELNQLFVHSKVLIVDDRWATVGSANLDGVSLHSYGDDFEGILGRRVFRHVRNFDVNAVLDDSADALDGAVRELRFRLWGEHLGVDADDLVVPPPDGWLARWRAHAASNVAALAAPHPASAYAGFVLPYNTHATPREQLEAMGVDMRHVHLHFNPSWLEVHCSPNWVRNMFA